MNYNHSIALFLILAVSVPTALSTNWAVIVAGSNNYYNYRHQADAHHAYHVIQNYGISQDNIILMAYDDIANNSQNPFPGQIFNQPDGQDVYGGTTIEYRGREVTSKNFLAVLSGDSSVTGGRKVLETTSDDKIFVYFTDHGAPGLVAFPSGDYLYATDLMNTIKQMHKDKRYGEMLIYIEACESGSMFEKHLTSDYNVYATTAANSKESSWAAYCSPQDKVQGKSIGSCLADEYSKNWLEDSDMHIETQTGESVGDQYEQVKSKTKKSHVQEFGDSSIKKESVSNFQGASRTQSESLISKIKSFFNHDSKTHKAFFKKSDNGTCGSDNDDHHKVDSRDVKMHHLYHKYLNSKHHSHALELQQEINHRMKMDTVFEEFKEKLDLKDDDEHVPTDTTCLKAAVDVFENKCGKFTDYSLKYVREISKACEKDMPYGILFHALQGLDC